MKKPFHRTIGIIGGGQLGKMLIESALPWNVHYHVLDPDPEAPCRSYAGKFIQAGLKDAEAIRQLASECDVLTFEIEHINTEVLFELESSGKTIIPSPGILKIIQDKGLQKAFYSDNHLPTAAYVRVNSASEWSRHLDSFPGEKIVAKLCREGYDGKGVSICLKSDIREGRLPFDGPCILEEFIEGCTELSVIVAGNKDKYVTWPTVEMHFDPKLNLVDYLYSPGNMPGEQEAKACRIAVEAVRAMKGVGVFAVEMFLTPGGDILINEIAPRPHNSGHHTIEACFTSQYEQLNRILLDLPLGDTTLLKPAVMVNLIGTPNIQGDYAIDGLDEAMNIPGFYLHLYKKAETRPGRKMGHFTVLADTTAEAIQKAMYIKGILKIKESN